MTCRSQVKGLLEIPQIPILKSILIETEPMILDIQGKQPLNACAYMYVFTKLNVFVWQVFLENQPTNIPTMYGSYWVRVIVFNATFNNISVISWWSVLLLQETGVPAETIDLLQTTDKLYHKFVSNIPCREWVPIGQWYCKMGNFREGFIFAYFVERKNSQNIPSRKLCL